MAKITQGDVKVTQDNPEESAFRQIRKEKALQKRKEIEEKLRQMLTEYSITKF